MDWIRDLREYAMNLKINWNSDIQIVKYKLVTHVIKYDWI
jgi:hypothetical protein